MALHQRFDRVYIQGLVDSNSSEGQGLEFKERAWARNDEGTREMLRDISSMANAYGGVIVVGIEEGDDGKAIGIKNVDNVEEERDRIYSSCLANLHPRIIGLTLETVDNSFLVVKVPDSRSLHQITFSGLYQFWIRHDRQKTRMSYEEIRDSILRNNSDADYINTLIHTRTERASIDYSPKILLCAVPIKKELELFKLDNQELRGLLKEIPFRHGGWNFNFTQSSVTPSLNGLVITEGDSGGFFKKLELFRGGYLEGVVKLNDYAIKVKQLSIDQRGYINYPTIRSIAIVELIYSFSKKLRLITEQLGYEGQYSIGLSLMFIESCLLPQYQEEAIRQNYAKSNYRILTVEPMVFECLDEDLITQGISDRIWNAFNFERAPYFEDGKFVGLN